MHRKILCLIVVLALGSSAISQAAWPDGSGSLPGLESGKSVAIKAGIIGGSVVAAALLYRHFRADRRPSRLDAPAALEFVGAPEKVLTIRNGGSHPAQVTDISIRGGGFLVEPQLSFPMLISAGSGIGIRVQRDLNVPLNNGEMRLSYIEDGKARTRVIALRAREASRK